MSETTDRNDPRLGKGIDESPRPQNDVYLVAPTEARLPSNFVRPVLAGYVHAQELGGCGATTRMSQALAETYAVNPGFYGATYCVGCQMHRPVGANGEFYWLGLERMTWEVGDVTVMSDQTITEQRLKVGT